MIICNAQVQRTLRFYWRNLGFTKQGLPRKFISILGTNNNLNNLIRNSTFCYKIDLAVVHSLIYFYGPLRRRIRDAHQNVEKLFQAILSRERKSFWAISLAEALVFCLTRISIFPHWGWLTLSSIERRQIDLHCRRDPDRVWSWCLYSICVHNKTKTKIILLIRDFLSYLLKFWIKFNFVIKDKIHG